MKWYLCIGLLVMTHLAFGQQVIEWNYNNQAVIAGSCAGEAQLISSGHELSMLLPNFQVGLIGGENTGKFLRKTCRIIVPTKVAAGYYIESMKGSLNYGYKRTEKTSGAIRLTLEFYNSAANNNFVLAVPTPARDPYSELSIDQSLAASWEVPSSVCKQNYRGNLKILMTIDAYRPSVEEDISVFLNTETLHFETTVKPCPQSL